jgi:anti-sigma B factor antagonist
MTLKMQKSFLEDKGLWNVTALGDVDISSAPMLRMTLDEAYKEIKADIILDFKQLSYLDSTGLGVILGAYGRLKEGGNRLTIQKPRDTIKKLLRITHLDKLLCPEICE